ncbi:Uu.00g064420.m01.CDS01 [Anthostomella pinea]|uniref:Uu.00g064420.m01.CDS01 n=1 Tax=Anthostomella pinea TaxID=933095 RepID=A0AAI8YKP1_9PEZI|nr:Uu.00g064420.m01.CDS01 [Anthostomella pinea]
MASETPSSTGTPASTMASDSAYKPRYIDIGINLADPIFRGKYHGTQRHPDDLSAVISRAQEVGCHKLIVTGSDLATSRHALEIAGEYPGAVYTTAGIHPCSSAIFSNKSLAGHEDDTDTDGHTTPCDPDPSKPVPEEDHEPSPEKMAEIISALRNLISESRRGGSSTTPPTPRLVAFGEIGLDYDRLHYCSRNIQLHAFAAQLDLVLSLQPQLPLFLHSRAAHGDFVALLKEKFGARLQKLERGGVVHSFTGTAAEMRELMDLGLYIGVNGCSFKTAENCAVVGQIEMDRLMLETDGPWCEVRPSHEGWKYLVEPTKRADGSNDNERTSTSTSTSTSISTPTPEHQAPPPPAKRQSKKKPQKKEPDVPERFKTVKREKWVEGAMVKGRNEPCSIERMGRIVAGIKGVSVEEVCEAAWRNTTRVFSLEDK